MNATHDDGPDQGAADPDHPDPPDRDTAEQLTAFAARVRAARRRAGMTQRDLANATGVGLRTITRIEGGQRTDPGFRRDVETFLRLHVAPAAPAHHPGDETGEQPDLAAIPTIALLAELLRREGEHMRTSGAAWTGPPSRVRWKKTDGPTESHASEQGRDPVGDGEEA